jgi:hypothetical protein
MATAGLAADVGAGVADERAELALPLGRQPPSVAVGGGELAADFADRGVGRL